MDISFVDMIYIINLKEREDRWKECKKQLDTYNIKNYKRYEAHTFKFENINPIEYSKNNLKINKKYIIGAYGCKHSHLEIIKDAKKHNFKSILILEDDFKLCTSFVEKTNKYLNMLYCNKKKIDMLYLGFNIMRKEPYEDTEYCNLKKLKTCFGTHSYIIFNYFYDKAIQEIEQCLCEIDVCYVKLQKKYNIYGIYPCLVAQRPDYSNIMNKNVCYNNFTTVDNS